MLMMKKIHQKYESIFSPVCVAEIAAATKRKEIKIGRWMKVKIYDDIMVLVGLVLKRV